MADFDRELLSARLKELSERSERGIVTMTAFLSPAELAFAEGLRLKNTFFFGGYKGAERGCIFFIPDIYDAVIDGMSDAERSEYIINELICDGPTALKTEGSGYKKLSHRDYLGSILALGVERSAIGDICVTGEHEAVIFALPKVSELIRFGLERVGSDKVSVTPLEAGAFSFERKTMPLTDTVASDRFDCVVASLCKKSRGAASELIKCGFSELNYLPCDRTDARVARGDVISVRGVGKFIIKAISEETKKGRIRLEAEKYV